MVLEVRPFHAVAGTDEAAALEVVGGAEPPLGQQPLGADLRLRHLAERPVERDRLAAFHLEIEFEVVCEVAADARPVGHDRDPVLEELRRGADARQHQELGRVDGPAREDDLAPRRGLDRAAVQAAGEAHGAAALEHHPLGQALRPDREVRARPRAVEVGAGGAPAHPVADGAVHPAEALLLVAVDVLGHGIAGLPARLDEGVVERVGQGAVARVERPVVAAVAVTAFFPRLGALEVGQHVRIGPAPRPGAVPGLEVHGVAADVHHAVDGRGAAEQPPARAGDAPPVEVGLRLGAVVPVGPLDVHRHGERARHADQRRPVVAAALDQQDGRGPVLGEAVGHDAAGGAGPDDDVVEGGGHGSVALSGSCAAPATACGRSAPNSTSRNATPRRIRRRDRSTGSACWSGAGAAGRG